MVVSAEGNSKVFSKLLETSSDQQVLVIADGAAFGPYIFNIVKYIEGKGRVALYFPESFEWLILKSGVLEIKQIDEVLSHPEDYIDSRAYASWERFFTAFLRDKSKDDVYKQYSKSELSAFYCTEKNSEMVLNVVPKDIREYLK